MTAPLAIPSLDTALDEYVALIKIQTDATSSKSKLLPEDIPFHRSLDRNFRTQLDLTSSRVLRLTNKLLQLAETLNSTDAKASGTRKTMDRDEEQGLRDEADVVDRFHSIVVDIVDPLLEHVVCDARILSLLHTNILSRRTIV
jgi:exosome complex exonuclease RRP6